MVGNRHTNGKWTAFTNASSRTIVVSSGRVFDRVAVAIVADVFRRVGGDRTGCGAFGLASHGVVASLPRVEQTVAAPQAGGGAVDAVALLGKRVEHAIAAGRDSTVGVAGGGVATGVAHLGWLRLSVLCVCVCVFVCSRARVRV